MDEIAKLLFVGAAAFALWAFGSKDEKKENPPEPPETETVDDPPKEKTRVIRDPKTGKFKRVPAEEKDDE